MEEFILCKIFRDVYKDANTYAKRPKSLIVEESPDVEKILEDYILDTMGYRVYREYQNYKKGYIQNFEYFGVVRKHFENVIVNWRKDSSFNICDRVVAYTKEYKEKIANHPYVDIFITAASATLSNTGYDVAVQNKDDSIIITKLIEKNEDDMPSIHIDDIDNLEFILEDYIKSIKSSQNSDTLFASTFSKFVDEKDAIYEILFWTLRNATTADLSCVENYYKRLNSFINDTTFDEYRYSAQKLGQLLGDEIYLLLRKSPPAYETPFYLSFMMKNFHIELPNIRFGIDERDGKKIAHILAIQSAQGISGGKKEKDMINIVKQLLPNSKYFREFNPSHLFSLTLAIGFFNGFGIKEIYFPAYLPLRYQRFVLEGRMNEDELHNFQHRLTNKFTNTFFRLMESCPGIHVTSYPENGNTTCLALTDNLEFNNEFLQKVYNTGYTAAKNQQQEIKKLELKDI